MNVNIDYYVADRRPNGRRYYRRRGPPRQPRQTQQDSQGEDKTEGTEGGQNMEHITNFIKCVSSSSGEGEGEQVDRRRSRGPPRRRFRRYRRGPRRNEEVCFGYYNVFELYKDVV